MEQKRRASSTEHSLFHISGAGTGPLLPIPAILNSAETAETRRLGNNRLSKKAKEHFKKNFKEAPTSRQSVVFE